MLRTAGSVGDLLSSLHFLVIAMIVDRVSQPESQTARGAPPGGTHIVLDVCEDWLGE